MADLLRRKGAVDDLPQLNRITVRRPAANISATVFAKGTNDWNQFTLLELLGVEYNFLSFPAQASPMYGTPPGPGNYPARLPFPDLVHLHIRRPTPGLKGWQEQVVDFSPLFLSGDCAKDLRLEWGDVVEIHETDHPLSAQWNFFPGEQVANVKRCLSRQVEIITKGQSTKITLAPGANATCFCVKPVLLGSNLLLASSDLSHVKVTRRVVAGREYHWVVDCSEGRPEPDLWLRDGDKIEVPEKGEASAAAPGPQTAAPK